MKALIGWVVLGLVLFAAAFSGAYFFQQHMKEKQSGRVKDITIASLNALKHQGRMTAFVARFVAAVPMGTDGAQGGVMVMPGIVRYEFDPGAIASSNVKWDAETRTLAVLLPKLSISSPQIDLKGIRRYGAAGGLIGASASPADEDNRRSAQAELIVQSQEEASLRLARDAARSTMERSFAMPLAASGIKATVKASFADEQGH